LAQYLDSDLRFDLVNTTFEEYSLTEKQDMIESLRSQPSRDWIWKRHLEYLEECKKMEMNINTMHRLHVDKCALEKQKTSIEAEEKAERSKRLELLNKITGEQLETENKKKEARKKRHDMIVQKRLLMSLKNCPSKPIKPIPPSDPLPLIRSPVRNNYVQSMPVTGKMPSLTTCL
jgi:hypothetical protein